MIRNYTEFCTGLIKAGFSGAIGGKDDGIFGLFHYGWGAEDDSQLHWHTGDPDTDPWEWRIRVLDERDGIAYSKVFFRKAGYITREWYPYFLAARRNGLSFAEAYEDGLYSHFCKRIYDALQKSSPLPLHEIKLNAGFAKEDKAKFDKALTDLQMGLFITMCGRQQKRGKTGEEYGWASTMFCTVEAFWPEEVLEQASGISAEDAEKMITERIYLLNPNADGKKVKKFICGK